MKYIIILISLTSLFAQTKEVKELEGIGEGHGNTKNIALRMALRNGVENLVGLYIYSESHVDKNRLKSDIIKSYSNALINRYELLELNTIGNSFYAKVKIYISDKILNYTFKKDKYNYSFDSSNLYAKTAWKFELIDNSKILIDNFIKNHFHLTWNFNLKEEDSFANYESKNVELKYSFSAIIDENFFDNIYRFLTIFKTDEDISKYYYIRQEGDYSRYDYSYAIFTTKKSMPGGPGQINRILDNIYDRYTERDKKRQKEYQVKIYNGVQRIVGPNDLVLKTRDNLKVKSELLNNYAVTPNLRFIDEGTYSEFIPFNVLPEIKKIIDDKLTNHYVKFYANLKDADNNNFRNIHIGHELIGMNTINYMRNDIPTFSRTFTINLSMEELKRLNSIELEAIPD